MAKNYLLQFGGGTGLPGLAPTFLIFKTYPGGTDVTPPGITQIPTSTGLYYFTYGPTLQSMAFVIDGATSSLSIATRYIVGNVDPVHAVDEALGNTFLPLGNTLTAGVTTLTSFMGSTASSFGSTVADPTTVYGYLKRVQEFLEGNSLFTKSSGVWNIWSRGSTLFGGASTQLVQKTLVDTSTTTTKS